MQLQDGLRVLVAEDDETNAKVARLVLERLGCHVDVAIHGGEAVELFQGRHYDVVLMDADMPFMNGFEATMRIRQHPRGGTVPILGTTFDDQRVECLKAGMDDLVSKPFERKKLKKALERWVRSRKE
jgi:CheY-like chemotaxis protein